MKLGRNAQGILAAAFLSTYAILGDNCVRTGNLRGLETAVAQTSALDVEIAESEVSVVQEETAEEVEGVCETTPYISLIRDLAWDDSVQDGELVEVLQGLNEDQWDTFTQLCMARKISYSEGSSVAVYHTYDQEFKNAVVAEEKRRVATLTSE